MKQCSRCKINKSLDQYAIKNRATGQLQYHCRECQKKASRSYYVNNLALHRTRCKIHSKRSEKVAKDFLCRFLLENPCTNCGEADILCLEFHHLDRNNKEYNVSELVKFSLDTLKVEMSKCVVLCANCHRRVTHKENNTHKYKWTISEKDITGIF